MSNSYPARIARTLCALAAILAMTVILFGCDSITNLARVSYVSMTTANEFNPREITAPAGSTIEWTNADNENHTVIVDPLNAAPDGPNSDDDLSAGLQPNQTWEWQVPINATSGTKWYYHCRFSGQAGDGTQMGEGMTGTITVE